MSRSSDREVSKETIHEWQAMFDQGRYAEVEKLARKAVAKNKKDGLAWKALAAALELQHKESLPEMEKALRLRMFDPEMHFNIGKAMNNASILDRAEMCYRRAILLKPDYPQAYNNLGNTLKELGRMEEALKTLWQGAKMAPHIVEIQLNLGNTLGAMGRHKEAIRVFECAVAIKEEFIDAHNAMIFVKDLDASTTVASAQAERRRWAAKFADTLWQDVRHGNNRDPQRKLRIGYVSGDFREHSAARVFGGMLIEYDEAQFEVFAYHNSKRPDDEYTKHFRACVDHWRNISELADQAAYDVIVQDKIDILVDLSGHTGGNRLTVFARRPAPIQVSAWGYVTGTGMKAMDVLFADPVLIPPEEARLYAEEVVYLPVYGGRLAGEPFPATVESPHLADGLITFGSLNRFAKITEECMLLWASVLKAVPNSGMVIKAGELADQQSRDALAENFVRLGIERGRLIIAGGSPWAEHMAAYNEIDIVLDTFPQTGGATSMEALMMGVPIVTLRHPTFAGRPTAAILTAMGMTDWIGENAEDYLRIATQKAQDTQVLTALRRETRARFLASMVGDNEAYCRAVERKYRDLWQQWCARAALPENVTSKKILDTRQIAH